MARKNVKTLKKKKKAGKKGAQIKRGANRKKSGPLVRLHGFGKMTGQKLGRNCVTDVLETPFLG